MVIAVPVSPPETMQLTKVSSQVVASSPMSCHGHAMMECATCAGCLPQTLLIYLSVSLRTSYPVCQQAVIMLQPLAKGDMSYS